MIPISKDISEKFINIDPDLHHDSKIHNWVNDDILEHSISTCDKQLEKKLFDILCKKKTCLYDNIKYIEGITWTVWMKNVEFTWLTELSHQIHNYVFQKLHTKIIYFKLKKYKKNINNSKDLLLDLDFVLYPKNRPYANHINIICMYYMQSQSFDILYLKVLGTISQDKIHMTTNTEEAEYSKVESDIVYHACSEVEDSFEEMTTHDDQVQDILYDKLMNTKYLKDESDSEDYWKNVEYMKNQNIVRNMFLKDKQTNKGCMKDTYKKYPYCNDFEIVI